MTLSVVTGPTVEPVSLTEAKTHLRVTGSDEDTYISALIAAARVWCENHTGMVFVERSLLWTIDALPSCADAALILPTAPVQSITSIIYTDQDGVETTWDSDLYLLDPDPVRPRLKPAYGESWPSDVRAVMNAVKITFAAGFEDDGASPPSLTANIPAAIIHAMKLAIGHFYEHRMEVSRDLLHDVPLAARALLSPYRIRGF
jgi:uncharacterized phiE125 gp8 family phage protein